MTSTLVADDARLDGLRTSRCVLWLIGAVSLVAAGCSSTDSSTSVQEAPVTSPPDDVIGELTTWFDDAHGYRRLLLVMSPT
jgi:hypothetical protein